MLLLMLPISSADGSWTNPVDALFTATTSVCVTGLVTVSTAAHWSIFGQIVILILIQFGGLGIVTFTTAIMIIASRRITLKDRLLIRDAYNLDSLSGLVNLTKRVLKGALIVEGIGAVFYMIVFIPKYGPSGIFKSIFNSISAFCNAGLDLIGDTSLKEFSGNVIINIVTMLLIVAGGLGFPVWWDLLKKKFRFKKYELHTKIVVTTTIGLILTGAILVFLFEFNNPGTIGDMPVGEKIQASFFQSVTTRTAGFYTVPQENLTNASSFVSIIFMFIGGSPSGTAGGVKTVTIVMIMLTAFAIVRGRDDTEAFGRKISESNIRKGLAVVVVSLTTLTFTIALLCITQKLDFLDMLYEAVSAIATVGLSRNVTGSLDTVGKLIITFAMYAGRIGPISLALFFNTTTRNNIRHYPEEKIRVG